MEALHDVFGSQGLSRATTTLFLFVGPMCLYAFDEKQQ